VSWIGQTTHLTPPHITRLQVTPAHDPNDFKTGKRHNLEFINIFDDNGNINEQGGPFAGQPRFKVGSKKGQL
jgi:valyl-tRNA synthetase